jgi:hypothetical protein
MNEVYNNAQKQSLLVLKDYEGDGFQRFYSEQMTARHLEVIDFAEPWQGMHRTRRYLHPLEFVRAFRRIQNMMRDRKIVLVFDPGHMELIPVYLRALPKGCRLVVWFWNTMDSITTSRFLKLRDNEAISWFTFDPGDADRFGIHLTHQVYFFPKCSEKSSGDSECLKRSAFFVGVDKDRFALLEKLSEQLERCSYRCDFHVLPSGANSPIPTDSPWRMSSPMDYGRVLEKIRGDATVVDIMKPGQTGMTVRCLEALRYGRKVITNNPSLLDPSVWNPRNAFLIGDGPIDVVGLRSFLAEPYDPSQDSRLMAMYSFEDWLGEIVGITETDAICSEDGI